MGTGSLFAWVTSKKSVVKVKYAKVNEKISTTEIIVLGSFLFISIDQLFILLLLIYLYRTEIENNYSSLFCIDSVIKNLKKISVSLYYILLIWPFIYTVSLLSNFFIAEAVEQNVVTLLRIGSIKEKLYIIISAIIVAPIIEELYFRHILYTKVKLYIGILPSTIICSILFGIIHKNVYAYITLFTLSIFLCVIREISGRTIFPIYIHSMFNIVMVTQIMLS